MSRRKKSSTPIDIDFTLRRVFGKKSFRYTFDALLSHMILYSPTGGRPVQREVITAAIEGHDVFLQAATSFGKSLCFQLPAVISSGSELDPSQSPIDMLRIPHSHHCGLALIGSNGKML